MRGAPLPDPADLLAIGVDEPLDVKLYRGMGCAACRGTGYRGRVGIYEMFTVDEEGRSLIMKQVSAGRAQAPRDDERHDHAPRGRLGEGLRGLDDGGRDSEGHAGRELIRRIDPCPSFPAARDAV